MTATGETTWTELTGVPADLLTLAERCYEADGGLPLATDPSFLGRRWTGERVSAFGVRAADGSLLAAAAARETPDGPAFTGLVDPAARGRGLGGELLDRGLELTAGEAVTVESESLTDAAVSLFESRGLHQIFAEEVMRIDLTSTSLPPAIWPDGAAVSTWNGATALRFHTTYHESFRDRPGFPGDPAEEWIAENEDDTDFLPGASLLVTLPGQGDAGFITAARGWVVQVGVVPFARRQGLAAALILESLSRLRAAGTTQAWLTVNANNPGAADLYRVLGFTSQGRRARYQP